MEADSRPSLSISFLNLPSPFHASHQSPYSPQTSPFSTRTFHVDTPNHNHICADVHDHAPIHSHSHTNNLPSSTSSWWPLNNTSKHRHHKTDEVDEAILAQPHGGGGDIIENAALQRTLQRGLVWELLALGGLIAFLVGFVVLCLKGGGEIKMTDNIFARHWI